MGSSYAVLALSALLWPLAGSLLVGFALITLTGFLEGPAYSGTIALRQRHIPAAVRGQVMNTLGSLGLGAVSLGAAIGGVIHGPRTTIFVFCALNLVAAAVAARVSVPGAPPDKGHT